MFVEDIRHTSHPNGALSFKPLKRSERLKKAAPHKEAPKLLMTDRKNCRFSV